MQIPIVLLLVLGYPIVDSNFFMFLICFRTDMPSIAFNLIGMDMRPLVLFNHRSYDEQTIIKDFGHGSNREWML